MKISAIVAMSKNRVIGKNNELPWDLPEDLKRFKAITMGHSIIMGRKTYESIGRPLPGRRNLIISRQAYFSIPGAEVFSSVDDALKDCQRGGEEEAFIIGGAQIYLETLKRVDRLYLTLIDQHMEGDTFFPEINLSEFYQVDKETRTTPMPHSFITLERRASQK